MAAESEPTAAILVAPLRDTGLHAHALCAGFSQAARFSVETTAHTRIQILDGSAGEGQDTTRAAQGNNMRLTALASPVLCRVAALLLAAACPTAVSAEANVSPRPAHPEVFTLSGIAGPPQGLMAQPSGYQTDPQIIVSMPGPLATALHDQGAESPTWRPGAKSVEWAAQGGAAVLLYRLSRKGRRRKRSRRRRPAPW